MRPVRLAAFSALFFGLAILSYLLKVPKTPLSLIWLPNVIAAVVETRAPRRFTADLLGGLLLGTMLSHALTGASLEVIALRCTGTLICVGGYVWAARRAGLERHAPDSTAGYGLATAIFCVAVALAAVTVSGPLVRLGVAPDYWTAVQAWWLANAAACCVVFPLGLTASRKVLIASLTPRGLTRLVLTAGAVAALTLLASRYVAVPYVEISTALIVAALVLPLFPSAVIVTLTLLGYGAANFLLHGDAGWMGFSHELELLPTALMMGGAMLVALIRQEREQRSAALDAAVAALEAQQSQLEALVDARTAALRASNAELGRANRQKDLFLANTSHEMRTPLHAIHAFSRMGRERLAFGRVDKVKIYLERIAESADRLSKFVDNLLDLSRMIAGKVSMRFRQADLAAVVEASIRALTSIAGEKSQRILVHDRLGRQAVEMDAEKFAQVVTNLVSNASKFSPNGAGIEIVLEDAELAGEPAVRLTVCDQGVGIPEAELSSIFDSFVQSSRTANGAGGTGLGLSISREIVRLHRGQIQARNRTGGGACFEVLLPRSQAAALAAATSRHQEDPASLEA